MTTRHALPLIAQLACAARLASAQPAILWFTVDGGGGVSIAGTITLSGTIGQSDTGVMLSGSFQLSGGYWAVGNACAADYNGNDEIDILDFLDFFDDFGTCLNQAGPCGEFGDADVNADTIVDILDFLDFLDVFGQGC